MWWKMESKYRMSDFSSLSVMCTVDKFLKTVESMNETVMVPSRLLNVGPPEKDDKAPNLLRGNADPYSFYSVLNEVKTNLLWGLTDNSDPVGMEKFPDDNSTWFGSSVNKNSTTGDNLNKDSTKGHLRRISSVSTASVVSSTSEQESERLSDSGDSGTESEEPESIEEITTALKTHLAGLQVCLSRLSETANYITEKYQEEVSA